MLKKIHRQILVPHLDQFYLILMLKTY